MPRLVKYADPRRPEGVEAFKFQELPDDEAAVSDLLSFASIGFGVAGMFLKNQWFSWAAFVTCIISMCNLSAGGQSSGPPTSMVSFAVLGLFTAYSQLLNTGKLTEFPGEVDQL
ncbi:hypothetical protein DFJ77DRAFT_448298 [Powellomyces hirtus]|nr:hypothetical protein DFJ77DRAFT_448298 [Powellomyces hirtus]